MANSAARILGLSGSLRQGSYNTLLLRAAIGLAPPEMTIELVDISGVPLYNGDVEKTGLPRAVHELREAIRNADGLLFATPEYNYSVPGVLKNAIDWVSRPPDQPFDGKPVAILGGGGGFGTTKAQNHLRQIGAALNMRVLPKPEVMIARVWEKVDDQGRITDEKVGESIRALLVAFMDWTVRLRA